VALIESGGKVEQETRLYDPDLGQTAGMRSKEHAHDYRYFPEPDLVPLRIGEAWLAEIRTTMPELPASRRARFTGEYGLREYDAGVLTQTRAFSDYFETVARASGDPKTAANWVMGDLAGALKAESKEIGESPVSAESLGALVKLIATGELSGKLAKQVFAKMFSTGDAPAAIVEREGLKQIDDTGALAKVIAERDRGQSQAGRAIPRRQDDRDQLPGGPGDEGHARAGQRGGGDGAIEERTGVTHVAGHQCPNWVLESAEVFDRLSVMPTRLGTAIRKRSVSRPTEHQAILLQRLGLQLPSNLEMTRV
jgi:hypothetical protein